MQQGVMKSDQQDGSSNVEIRIVKAIEVLRWWLWGEGAGVV